MRIDLHTDAKGLVDRVHSRKMPLIAKRRRLDIADLKECISRGELYPLKAIDGVTNPVDPLTKSKKRAEKTSQYLVQLLSTGWYEPHVQDTRNTWKRRKKKIAEKENGGENGNGNWY